MRAAVLEEFGAPLRVTDLDIPVAGPGQVLVRIHASGVNPLDLKIRAGQAGHARTVLPAVLGLDLAGQVEAVGPGVTAFRRGDQVYGLTGGVGALQGLRSTRRWTPGCSPTGPPLWTSVRPPRCRWP
jgi:NADPH:quinone reductase-like Zn-dependent oxidoreductase